MNNIELSVVIPCYNASQFCGQLSECISNQIGGGKIEFILVDDGSNDKTLDHLKRIKSNYPEYVQVIAKMNGGVSSARNAGLEVAKGKWIGFLDSDDVFAPGGLSFLMENCIDEDIDILQFKSNIVSHVPARFSELSANVTNIVNGRDFYLQTNAITVWSFLYRNDYIKKHLLRFRELTIGEDTLFNFEAFMADGRIKCVDTIVTYHIDREGSLTTSTNPAYVRKIVDSAIYMQKVYTDYLSANTVASEIIEKVADHRKRNVLFCFQKIRTTPGFAIREIRDTAARFNQYGTLSLCRSTTSERFVIFLYNNPYAFKLYIYVYWLVRKTSHIIKKFIR